MKLTAGLKFETSFDSRYVIEKVENQKILIGHEDMPETCWHPVEWVTEKFASGVWKLLPPSQPTKVEGPPEVKVGQVWCREQDSQKFRLTSKHRPGWWNAVSLDADGETGYFFEKDGTLTHMYLVTETPTVKPGQVWRYKPGGVNTGDRRIEETDGVYWQGINLRNGSAASQTVEFLQAHATLLTDTPEDTHKCVRCGDRAAPSVGTMCDNCRGAELHKAAETWALKKFCNDCGDAEQLHPERVLLAASGDKFRARCCDPCFTARENALSYKAAARNAEYADRHKQAIKDSWAALAHHWTPPDTGACRWQRRR